jgi:Putative DNA-binding domain
MPSLRELQTTFGRALLGADGEELACVRGDGLAPSARVQIYRHHVFASLTKALKDTYPVVCRLVDERFFAFAADHYIRTCPPAAPCLFEYGGSFPRFLALFPPC